jgi:hypothetical protein
MAENATDAIREWITNDPTRYDTARATVREEGLDYLRDYLIEEIQEAGEYPETSGNVHDGGPYYIGQNYSPTQILNADWEEIRDTLCPLPTGRTTDVRSVIQSAVGEWCSPATVLTPAGQWIAKVVRAYEDDRKTILWSEDPEGTADDYLPALPAVLESWEIWTELQLWRFDAQIAYGGLAFDQEEDWDHQTMTYKQSALEPRHIEMRTKENIGSLPGRVLAEIQDTIMSQLLQDDLKAWEQ